MLAKDVGIAPERLLLLSLLNSVATFHIRMRIRREDSENKKRRHADCTKLLSFRL